MDYHIDPQLRSELITRLPPEIRIMIWEAVLGNNWFRVQKKSSSISVTMVQDHAPIDYSRDGLALWDINTDCPCCWTCMRSDCPRASWHHTKVYTTKIVGLTGLILSCRLIYHESLPILYQSNIFEMRNVGALTKFHELLPHSHTDHIRALSLHYHYSEWDTDEKIQHIMGAYIDSVGRGFSGLRNVFFLFFNAAFSDPQTEIIMKGLSDIAQERTLRDLPKLDRYEVTVDRWATRYFRLEYELPFHVIEADVSAMGPDEPEYLQRQNFLIDIDDDESNEIEFYDFIPDGDSSFDSDYDIGLDGEGFD